MVRSHVGADFGFRRWPSDPLATRTLQELDSVRGSGPAVLHNHSHAEAQEMPTALGVY